MLWPLVVRIYQKQLVTGLFVRCARVHPGYFGASCLPDVSEGRESVHAWGVNSHQEKFVGIYSLCCTGMWEIDRIHSYIPA